MIVRDEYGRTYFPTFEEFELEIQKTNDQLKEFDFQRKASEINNIKRIKEMRL